ncbi:ATPase, T2SS/T4P/T4SS family [Halomonas sp. CH40]
MFQVRVDTAKGMHVGNFYITENQCALGKKANNDIVLHGWKISSDHALLSLKSDGVYVKNLSNKVGTKVNGKPIDQYGPVGVDDVIEIHDYRIQVSDRKSGKGHGRDLELGSNNRDEATKSQNVTPVNINKKSSVSEDVDATASDKAIDSLPEKPKNSVATQELPDGAMAQSAALSQHAVEMHEWRVKLRKMLHEQMDLRRINVSTMSESELRDLAYSLTERTIKDVAGTIPHHIDKGELLEQVVAEAVGLGPLESLLARDDISEIMVNSCQEVFFETGGKMYKSDVTFTDDQAVQATIERIVTPVGRRIDESSPMVDARLKDGSRVNAIIPPLALKGSCLTVRKFMKHRLHGEDLVNFGSVDQGMIDFLKVAVQYKRNILVSGGTGSGKTTLLNVLSNFIPESERIVTIEDSAELQLFQPNLVPLEARPPNQEGRGGVSIRDLVKNSLRMRPDRIVVGECRGGEALDMLQAMNTGHDGSLTTAHANSPRDCLSRVEVMVMMAGMDLPAVAIREQIASAVHLVVQQTRFSCGSRKITGISEVVGVENGRIQLAEVFKFNATGYDESGRVSGHFTATGLIPEFYEGLKNRGIGLDLNIFEPWEKVS